MNPSPEIRSQEIKLRRAEILVALSAMKHRYISGEQTSFVERTALEAEDAELALELLRIKGAAEKAKVFRRMALNAELLSQLLKLLEERGHWDLALEASERSNVELAAITPWRTTAPANGEQAL